MTKSRQIAGILGPTLITLAVTEAINFRSLSAYAGPALAPLIYLNGTLLFVAGLSIVRAHNRWTRGWPIVVTMIGWLVMFAGLARMIAPVSAQIVGENTTSVVTILIVLFASGIFLSVKAYSPESRKTILPDS